MAFGDLVIGTWPNINDFIIAFTRGHKPCSNWLSISRTSASAASMILRFGRWNKHIFHVHRYTWQRRLGKTQIHQLVSKHDAVFHAHFAVARIDKASDVFLGHLFVDFVKAHTFWGDIPNQTATRNGINHFVTVLPLPSSSYVVSSIRTLIFALTLKSPVP